jgi:NTP pyrophosphatase (non-canonical NTP hydrolase)
MSHSIGWVDVGTESMRYDKFVYAIFKQDEYYKMLSHAVRGICTEAGEINDAVKKHLDYEKELNLANLIEELGDLRFYMQAIMNMFSLDEQMILQVNAAKLLKRYPSLKYSNADATERKDKQ